MIGFTHQDESVKHAFSCSSRFTPYVEPEPMDPEPAEYKAMKKRDGGIEYLPGERLLIELGKQKKKKKKIDVKKITESLGRVLASF